MIRLEEGPRRGYVTYVLLGRVGDAVMATSFMQALRRRYPDARYRLVASAACSGLEGALLQRLIEPLKTSWVRKWTQAPANLAPLFFLREPSQAVIDLNPAPSKSAAALVALSSAGAKVGFRKSRYNAAYTHQVDEPREDEPMLDRYKRLAALFDVPPEHVDGPALSVGPIDADWARQRMHALGRSRYKTLAVGIHAGNFKKFDNRWPEEKFIALADRLSEDPGLQLYWLAGPGEREKVQAIAAACRKPAPLLPAGSLGQTAGLIEDLDALICNITGTTHLAHAVGTPTFGLYSGYTNAVWRLPREDCGGVVSSEWASCRSIGVDEAYSGIRTFLARIGKE